MTFTKEDRARAAVEVGKLLDRADQEGVVEVFGNEAYNPYILDLWLENEANAALAISWKALADAQKAELERVHKAYSDASWMLEGLRR